MTKPLPKKPTKVPKALRAPKTRPPLLLPAAPSANPGRSKKTAPLPGFEEPRIDEIREKALRFFQLRDEKASLVKRVGAAEVDLLDAMHAHKLKRYFDVEAQLMVEIEESAEKVRVTVGKDDEE